MIDVIAVTVALGFRNLWIDSLCIIQDRVKEKLNLINAMDSIYSQAALTLVAATGDTAHSGLSGWSRESREEVRELTATVASDLTIRVIAPMWTSD
ncbi:hypothetical protein F4815DRAFT_438258 [Daldinia loculata]|nr:hypothetical protein F4815DRAFT_438258 [Daldinia loculata]